MLIRICCVYPPFHSKPPLINTTYIDMVRSLINEEINQGNNLIDSGFVMHTGFPNNVTTISSLYKTEIYNHKGFRHKRCMLTNISEMFCHYLHGYNYGHGYGYRHDYDTRCIVPLLYPSLLRLNSLDQYLIPHIPSTEKRPIPIANPHHSTPDNN